MNEEFSFSPAEEKILKRIPKVTLAVSLFLSIGSAFLFSPLTSLFILTGGLISVISFIWLKDSIAKLTSLTKKKAVIRGLVQYLFRFLLIFASFFIIIKISQNNLFSFFIGFSSIVVAVGMEAILAWRETKHWKS
ncbi:MAG: ATP synthase subunit I [Candidatus Aminicenantia bacterium]